VPQKINAGLDIGGPLLYTGAVTANISGDVNDWNPTGLATAGVLRVLSLLPGGVPAITGLAAQDAGRAFILGNMGSTAIRLVHQSTSSAAANRFVLPGGADIVMAGGDLVTMWYDGFPVGSPTNRWVVVNHQRAHDHSVAADGSTLNPLALNVNGPLALVGEIRPTPATDQDNYNPTGLAGASVISLIPSAPITITGLAGGAAGRQIVLINKANVLVTLAYNSGSSSAGNRFITPGAPANAVLGTNQSAILEYDAVVGYWYILPQAHPHDHSLTGDGTALTPASLVTAALYSIGKFVLNGEISPSALTADTNDWNPTGLAAATSIRISANAANWWLSSIVSGGEQGRILILENVGAYQIIIRDQDAALGTSGNRIIVGAAGHVLAPGSSCILRYDVTGGRWRLVGPINHPIVTVTGPSANQALTANAWNYIDLATETGDPLREFTPGTAGYFVPKQSGYYEVAGQSTLLFSTTRYQLWLHQDGSQMVPMDDIGAGTYQQFGIVTPFLTAGHTYQLGVYPSGSTTTLAAQQCSIKVRRVT
jgi:hypothetical protein